MRLTGKDIAATTFTGMVVAVYIAFLQGATLPLITSARGTTGVVLALGWLGGCALSGVGDVYTGAQKQSVALMGAMSTIGVVALVAAVTALATGSQAALTVLVAATVVLWLSTTLRHLLTRSTTWPGEATQEITRDRMSTTV